MTGRFRQARPDPGFASPRRSARAASRRNSSSTSVRIFSSLGGHPLGVTDSSIVRGSTAARSFDAWYTANASCNASMPFCGERSGISPASTPSTKPPAA